MCVHVRVCACLRERECLCKSACVFSVPLCVLVGVRGYLEVGFSSTLWVLRIELRLAGLVATLSPAEPSFRPRQVHL